MTCFADHASCRRWPHRTPSRQQRRIEGNHTPDRLWCQAESRTELHNHANRAAECGRSFHAGSYLHQAISTEAPVGAVASTDSDGSAAINPGAINDLYACGMA